MADDEAPERLMVIDIGSNSTRGVVLEPGPAGHLEIVAGAQERLQLTRHLDEERRLRSEAVERVIETVEDLSAIAEAAGSTRIMAVGTSALRDAPNGSELLERLDWDEPHEVRVLSGDEEAECAFLGAVFGLPVEDGLVVDIGGGSAELTEFRARRLVRTWTLPLGALRATDAFLASDPPTTGELKELRAHVASALAEAGVPRLRGGALVGTGGTIRNLAKIDLRGRQYPLGRLHGYPLRRGRLTRASTKLQAAPLATRGQIAGLNPQRADSIVGGAAVLEAIVAHTRAREVVVSGQGLREGVARRALIETLPGIDEVRAGSVQALSARFSRWDAGHARRRTSMVRKLVEALEPDATSELRAALDDASTLLDIGLSIDFYNRERQAAALVQQAELMGFTHRDVALVVALLRGAERPFVASKSLRPLVRAGDDSMLERAGALLAAADQVERRLAPEVHDLGTIDVTSKVARVCVAQWSGAVPNSVLARFEAAFGLRLEVAAGT
ncbi:MAG: Ppx/GppA phosphatase family protein [Dehalococcoidia bacterium]